MSDLMKLREEIPRIELIVQGATGEKLIDRMSTNQLLSTDNLNVSTYSKSAELLQNSEGNILIITLLENWKDNEELSFMAGIEKTDHVFVLAVIIDKMAGGAEKSYRSLIDKAAVDSILVISENRGNDDENYNDHAPSSIEDVLYDVICRTISLLNVPSVINLGYEDIVRMMTGCIVRAGTGFGIGDDKGKDAVSRAFCSSFHDQTFVKAKRFVLDISGDISLLDASDAAECIRNLTGPDVEIVFGASYSEMKPDYCNVMVLACG